MDDHNPVRIWKETITIPTYPAGKPDKNPMFFQKRVYQGSSGVVYPNPIIEKIHDEKVEKTYTGLFLENKYIKILILPELGGRVQMAYDKIKERHFVYHNQVIKPALVGLLGPWISGGIEFNWPQHHRPSTFQPIDYKIDENEDGSVTAWTNEIELMFHTKGMAGFTIYPDKAYLEINVQLYNRTALPQTFLWWANPAVSVDEHYQSVFPPDVNAVFDHGKRDVASFPIAKDTYYKVDYSPGTDISRYKNLPVPTSYMAIQSDYDFVGGYEYNTEGGLLHVANHHVSPGKKQWTWGNGDFGKAWDRNLTDEDGPYIELMTGVYTDNQPDFSWLMPYEEKSFSQYFMPYQKVGVVKNATKDIILSIEPVDEHKADLKIYATSEQACVQVKLFVEEELVFEDQSDLSPESVYEKSISLDQHITEENYVLIIEDSEGFELIRYEPSKNQEEEFPEPAKPAKQPEEIESTEQLYLTGLHLEQYRHATYRPEPYYKEALKRDPKDIRNNNALGKWYLRHGRFEEGEAYFRTAIESLTERNPNPYNGEPYYNLGLCLKYQGKLEEAYAAFYKSAWNSAWQDKAYFSLSEINTVRGEFEQALEQINWSLDRNARNSKGWSLKAAILRKKESYKAALVNTETVLGRDPFNLSAYYEQHLIYNQLGEKGKADGALNKFLGLSRKSVQNLIAYALDYASAGLFDEAIQLLSHAIDGNEEECYPMVLYYLGWFHAKKGDEKSALKFYQKAATAPPDYCFPNRLQAIPVLREAMEYNNEDSMAPYYLGCLFYDRRQDELAIRYWENSKEINSDFPTVHRNLGIAYFNKLQKPEKAIQSFEKAFFLDTYDARILMELDQLYKRTNKDPRQRLQFLEKHMDLVEFRDDLYLERAALYNFLGEYGKAYDLIMDRKFHPWEGGEGRVSGQYVYSLTELAKEDIQSGSYQQAIEKLEKARVYPENLGEGKLYGTRENDIFYWLGVAYDGLKESGEANKWWRKATEGDYEPEPAIFYNDQPADKILYQALAFQQLGESDKARALNQMLIKYGQKHMKDEVNIDYFAVSLPDLLIFDGDLSLRNKIHCTYMMALGNLGAEKLEEATSSLHNILEWDAMHVGAKTHLGLSNNRNNPNLSSNVNVRNNANSL
ncbi:DUF5107 domain-containing protein [Gracilimonas mengyeensis]|uniref:Tetratricopeptide repeat-containing protein n=1 Tax=Gracilimonas mengyeensis TaxID=1302730 RepID=A0A521BSM8_9BACT|nr:DUF5107 domain-containing protein [Gracilimonas mengyeensis]SMO50182.1 Tetratricopeptide repeat-containing protein [Gracilimonas mengyeensis]